MNSLPPLPQQLPKTQADWAHVITVLQSWQSALQAPKWLTPTLLNGWSAYGRGYNPPSYLLDITGRVWLRGMLVGTAASTTAFALPWVPKYEQLFCAMSSGGAARVDVTTAGNVVPAEGGSGAVGWISLDGLSFSLSV